jgi:hypothetical protein
MHIRVGVLHKKCKLFVKWYDSRKDISFPTPTEKIKKCFNASSASWLQ